MGLCEVEGGIISDYRILEEGDPKDEKAKSYLAFRDVPAAVRAVVEAFGREPRDAFGRQRSDARARGKTSSLAKAGAQEPTAPTLRATRLVWASAEEVSGREIGNSDVYIGYLAPSEVWYPSLVRTVGIRCSSVRRCFPCRRRVASLPGTQGSRKPKRSQGST